MSMSDGPSLQLLYSIQQLLSLNKISTQAIFALIMIQFDIQWLLLMWMFLSFYLCISIYILVLINSLVQYNNQRKVMSKYDSRADPLELLRGVFADGKRIKFKENHLIFEKDVRLPLSQKTAWVATQSHKQYNLGSLWLYLEHSTGSIFDYMQRITEYGLENVLVSDRKEIDNYFLKKDSTTNCINQQLKLQLSTKNQSKTREHPTTRFDLADEPAKKQKLDTLTTELQVIDFINKFQRPISSKSRSLRCPSKSYEPLLKVLHINGDEQIAKIEEKKMRINIFADGKKCPIIIVPECLQAGNLSLGNIQKFLVSGEYVANPPQLPEHQRKCEIALTIKGKKITFEVCSNPKLMAAKDWGSVVAVFVQGRKNEFDGWPCSEPTLIFKQAKGFHLKFPSKEDNQCVEWNIKEFTLDRNVRYRDAGIQREIIGDIEGFLFQKL